MATYRDKFTGKEYNSRLACAWDVYRSMVTSPHDDYEMKHGVATSTKILSGAVFTLFSPVWFPIAMFEPFPFQKPGRIEKVQ